MSLPFGSERGGGQDIATHFLRTDENEYVEVKQIRGAASTKLHGAMLEWEFQAKATTNCQKPFFCMAVNPDELQDGLTEDQYFDYIDRAEKRLGLTNQPRAIVAHIKNGREHWHVVWSRIDREKRIAINLPFWKDKLMTTSREFARDHGIVLPDGYRRHEDREWQKNKQQTYYDSIQQKETGLSFTDHMEAVTKAWHASDSGPAFVNALEELGYGLGVGDNGTRLVLVDIYGHTRSLVRSLDVKMDNGKNITAAKVRKFLGDAYAPENLPTVHELQQHAEQHRKAIEDFQKARAESEKVAALRKQQEGRRHSIEAKIKAIKAAQAIERDRLKHWHKQQQSDFADAHLETTRRILADREANKPTGLARFLGKVTGISLITKKLHERRDRQREKDFYEQQRQLTNRQKDEDLYLRREQSLKRTNLEKEQRSLNDIEARELKSLQLAMTAEQRMEQAKRYEHLPTFILDFSPPRRPAAPHKAANRHISQTKQELEAAEQEKTWKTKKINLVEEFTSVAGDDGDDDGDGGGNSGGQSPKPPTNDGPDRPKRPNRRNRRDKRRDFDRGM